jgi:transposase
MRMETFIRKQLGMKAHWVTKVEETAEGIVARVDRLGQRRLRCGECGRPAPQVLRRDPARRWRHLPLGSRPCELVYRPHRVGCVHCGVRVEQVPWAPRWSRVTGPLSRAIAQLARQLSWQEVAQHFQVDWKTVATTVRRVVAWGLEARSLDDLRVIGIDEVSRKKGHSYLTLVYDLRQGRLVWVGEDRRETTLEAFFAWLGPDRARQVEVVCLDMWAPYAAVVQRHAPQATLVFDRFHLVRHLNVAVDEVRRAEARRLHGEARQRIKGTRYLLLKNPWNLTPTERRRLSTVVRLNTRLVRAYYLKEEFQAFWPYIRTGWASKHLQHWLWWASHSRLAPFTKLAKLVRAHLPGILAWTRVRVTNGALEGMNNKIKLVSHRAYGYRNPQTYIAAIYHCCAQLPLPA